MKKFYSFHLVETFFITNINIYLKKFKIILKIFPIEITMTLGNIYIYLTKRLL
jgi:hypothetical protein